VPAEVATTLPNNLDLPIIHDWAVEVFRGLENASTRQRRHSRSNTDLEMAKGNGLYPTITDQRFEKLGTYQDIRAFSRQTQQLNLVIYGAITAYVLPVAYSLLGACAFALRNMAAQTGTKTYQPSYSNRARLIVALIAGTVVGLFNNFLARFCLCRP
jgi:hypothetical protein